MKTNRLFNLSIAITLVVIIALTIREAAATAGVIARVASINEASSECDSLPSHYSIHTEYVRGEETWLTYTEDGPTGIDGGLIHLLSAYRTCAE